MASAWCDTMAEINNNNLPATQEEKKDLMNSAKDFVNNIFQPLKGKDLSQAVEEFTAEMTLVAEGMSEDLERLTQQTDKLSAQQTILEETTLDRLHNADVTAEEVKKELKLMQKRLDKIEKAVADKKISKVSGFTGLLRQATWLCGIVVAGWIIVTLIKTFT